MTTVNITTKDPNNFLSSLPLLGATIQAAVDYLSKYVVFRGTMDIEVKVEATSTGRFHGGGDIVLTTPRNGRETWESAAVAESRTGVDPNPSTPDFTIYIDPMSAYVSGLWWDPKIATSLGADPPDNRTDAFTLVVHELLHGMGVTGWRNIVSGALPGTYQSVWDSQIAVSGGLATFQGAATKALLGKGVEVRLGGSQGAFHLGNGPSIADSSMPWLEGSNLNGYYYYLGERYTLGRLELAILKDLGWTLKTTTLTNVVDRWEDRSAPFYKVGWETSETLTGGPLGDRLEGRGGDDKLTGLGGNDTIKGGTGKDNLLGGTGGDDIIGGTGRDIMTGGTGSDEFDFNSRTETGTKSSTRDIITDFRHLTDDIDLSTIDASSPRSGNNTFVWKGTGSFTNSTAGELRYKKFDNAGTSNDYTVVYGDTDGDKSSEFQIQLKGLVALSSSDFSL